MSTKPPPQTLDAALANTVTGQMQAFSDSVQEFQRVAWRALPAAQKLERVFKIIQDVSPEPYVIDELEEP